MLDLVLYVRNNGLELNELVYGFFHQVLGGDFGRRRIMPLEEFEIFLQEHLYYLRAKGKVYEVPWSLTFSYDDSIPDIFASEGWRDFIAGNHCVSEFITG